MSGDRIFGGGTTACVDALRFIDFNYGGRGVTNLFVHISYLLFYCFSLADVARTARTEHQNTGVSPIGYTVSYG